MTAPLAYAEECGPRSLAALLDLTPEAAAELLWPARAFWFNPSRPAGGEAIYGTPESALEDVLLRAGCDVDVYGADGRLLADTSVLSALLRRQAGERAWSVRRAPPPRACASEPSLAWLAELRTLADWLERHRVGRWLYGVTDGKSAHVVAAWGPEVLVGDPEGRYRTSLCYWALRIFRPKYLNEGVTE